MTTRVHGTGTCHRSTTDPWRGQCHRRHPGLFHVRRLFHLRDSAAAHDLQALAVAAEVPVLRDLEDKEAQPAHRGSQDNKIDVACDARDILII